MKNEGTAIWKDVPVPIIHKIWHIHKVGKRVHRDFTKDYGDVPVAYFNRITKQFEPCDNPRGNAYAARRRLAFRRTKNDLMNKGHDRD